MKKNYLLSIIVFVILLVSCQKIEMKPGMVSDSLAGMSKNMINGTFQLSDPIFENHDDDSIERPTVLGIKLTNPYLIPNMTQAYHNLDIYNVPVIVTNLYVRFKPSSADQLNILDSTMEARGLDLFDTPIDYDVTYEGDYYQDPAIPQEQITWQYAVVPPNFQFPSGIQYESLAQIHIPSDNYTIVETEAERLASLQDSLNFVMTMNGNVVPNLPSCLPGYHLEGNICVPDDCPTGYHWNGSSCVPNNPPPPPPPPAPDAAVPAGNISVFDTNLGQNLPVRKARMVARRWFKTDRTYTDNSGHYQFNKRFKHKVRIIVKFKNDDAQIRNIRGISFWQMFFPVKREIGIFSGNKSNIPTWVFTRQTTYAAKGNIFWTAATVHNAVQDYRGYAPQEGIGLPPQGLKIFISRLAGTGAATPMFAKRQSFSLSTQFVLTKISSIASIVNSIIAIVKGQIDMIIGYRYADINNLLSDRLKESVYHELTHAGHYAALGNSWYTTFVTAEEIEIVNNISSGFSPYGNGTNSSSPIVALGESWAYYMGHFLADRTYGLNSSQSNEQNIGYINNSPIAGLSSHLNLLEDFSPFRTADPFYWIPQGLFYDLNDARNDMLAVPQRVAIDDQVSGFTRQQMFTAFQSNIYTLQDYRLKLIQQNPNNQSAQITNLFSRYGY